MRLEARRLPTDPIVAVVASMLDDADQNVTLEHREILAWTDGVLTATAIGPERVGLDELARAVFGKDRPFDDAETTRVSTSLLGLMHNMILQQLKREGADYAPRFLADAQEGEAAALAAHWAEGFFAGMRLRSETWKRFIGTDEGRRLLGPVVVFLSDEDGSPLVLDRRLHEVAEIKAEALQWLGHTVFEIWRYWKARAKGATRATIDPFRKIGRNEPCPCGSGKKHKKCCLDRAEPSE